MKSFLLLAILSTVICVSVSASSATTFYVDGSVSSSADGTSWETAFKKIQEGIDAASDGDTVIVAQGTYVENIRFRGKITVLTSTAPFDPTVVANTVIDGNQAGPVVTFAGNEKEATTLSGFTIRNGKGDPGSGGGGILGRSWLGSTGATIENNVITENSALLGGGLHGCAGTIQKNTITGNWAQEGGGLYYCAGTIQNNTITGNSAGWGGGLNWCDGTIQNNTIAGNSADAYGGGLNWCHATIQNNVIAGNSARQGGGVFACNGMIRNCTIIENSANEREGGLSNLSYDATIVNSIIWGNRAPITPQLSYSATPTYSCIQDWASGGEGNIADIPRFVRSGYWDDSGTPFVWVEGDYHLRPDSPCIDAGKNEDWMWEGVDLDGNPRILGGTVDMGAYEYGSIPFEVIEVTRAAGDGLELKWRSRPGQTYAIHTCSDLCGGTWAEVATVSSDGSEASWTDPDLSTKVKFYRVEMK